MTYPTRFPLNTKNYEDYFYLLRSNDFLRIALTNWDMSFQTYDTNLGHPDTSVFKPNDDFKLSDLKQTWFTYPYRHQKWMDIIEKIKIRLAEKNQIVYDPQKMGSSIVIMVPCSQVREHIDSGSYAGTSIIFPILGACEIIYNNNERRFLIDKPTFASNTVWHNFINKSNSLAISLIINLQIDISELKEDGLIEVPELL